MQTVIGHVKFHFPSDQVTPFIEVVSQLVKLCFLLSNKVKFDWNSGDFCSGDHVGPAPPFEIKLSIELNTISLVSNHTVFGTLLILLGAFF